MSELSEYQKKIYDELADNNAFIYTDDWEDSFVLINRDKEYGERGIRPSTVHAMVRKGVLEPQKPYFRRGARRYNVVEKEKPKPPTT